MNSIKEVEAKVNEMIKSEKLNFKSVTVADMISYTLQVVRQRNYQKDRQKKERVIIRELRQKGMLK